jgi:Cupin domain
MQMRLRSTGPPLHVHPTHGEGFYVLGGHPTFQVGTQVFTAREGAWLFAPRGIPHTLANRHDEPALLLCVFAPGGFERRFERMLAHQSGGELPPDLEELTEAERATRAVGPPLSMEHDAAAPRSAPDPDRRGQHP